MGEQTKDSGKTMWELVVATLPVVLLYFVGWVYLHYYLLAFGIGISELDLDLQTILLHSLPPVRILIGTYWGWLFVVIAVISVVFVIARRLGSSRMAIGLAKVFPYMRSLPWLVQATIGLAFLVVLVVLLANAIRIAAFGNADMKWTSEGIRIEATVSQAKGADVPSMFRDYRECRDRRALDLIISDKSAYYMLCISGVEPTSGVVFEVRRESGLASSRLVQKPY